MKRGANLTSQLPLRPEAGLRNAEELPDGSATARDVQLLVKDPRPHIGPI